MPWLGWVEDAFLFRAVYVSPNKCWIRALVCQGIYIAFEGPGMSEGKALGSSLLGESQGPARDGDDTTTP